ncbi:MAG: tetratricopeptide repeat protein [Candidatus Hydrogenedentes bacterium]|nr:tetratricopeptide repeat protein [Candidatus Hydrogenedentota bacterium]
MPPDPKLVTRARRGDAKAMHALGKYWDPWEEGESERRAFYWYRKAAERGNPDGMYEMGCRYFYPFFGYSKKQRGAYQWFLQAAELGHIGAQTYVGNMLCDGEGVRKNPREGVKWIAVAASKNDLDAIVTLGVCLFYGTGIKRDRPAAVRLYRKAIKKGASTAYWNLALCYYYGDVVKKDFSKAAFWLKKVVHSKSYSGSRMRAKFLLGDMYAKGRGVRQSDRWAFYWYKKMEPSLEYLAPDALHALGMCYLEGRGTKPDIEKARRLLDKSAKKGHKPSKSALKTLARGERA